MNTSEGSAPDFQWYYTYSVCDLWLCSCVRKMICVDKSYPCFLTSSASIHGDHQCLVDFYSQFSLSALTVDTLHSNLLLNANRLMKLTLPICFSLQLWISASWIRVSLKTYLQCCDCVVFFILNRTTYSFFRLFSATNRRRERKSREQLHMRRT